MQMNIAVEGKLKLEIKEGRWWALINRDDGIETWAPIGRVAALGDMADVTKCAILARWYWSAGLLGSITGPIFRERGGKLIEIIRGTAAAESINMERAKREGVIVRDAQENGE